MNEFNKEMFKQAKVDINEYELYELVDGASLGDYFISIYFDCDMVTIIVYDLVGNATMDMKKDTFLTMGYKDFDLYLNETLYYNYIENEE